MVLIVNICIVLFSNLITVFNFAFILEELKPKQGDFFLNQNDLYNLRAYKQTKKKKPFKTLLECSRNSTAQQSLQKLL